MARPVTREDVQELRSYFLDIVETVIVTLWKGEYKPGDGSIDGDWQSVPKSEIPIENNLVEGFIFQLINLEILDLIS